MRRLLILCFCCTFAFTIQAQLVRKYSNEFLTIGVGARSLGMSNAFVGTADDVTAGYWNPAGLTQLNGKTEMGLMHAEYFAGIAKYDYAAFCTPMDNTSYAGISFIRFGVDGIPDTSELIDANGNTNFNRVKSISAADYALILSYARKAKVADSTQKSLSYGANAKIIHRTIGPYGQSWGFGLDAGVQYRIKKFQLALMARDISSTFNAWRFTLSPALKEALSTTGNEIPKNSIELTVPKFIVGFNYRTQIKEKIGLNTELDLDLNTDGKRNTLISAAVSIDPHAGLELDYNKTIYLRSGIGNIQKIVDFTGKQSYTLQPNIGIGLRIKKVSIDYALTNISGLSDVLYSNIFSLKINLNR